MIAGETFALKPGLVVLGIGNMFRHDDGVGIFVARRIKREVGDLVSVYDNMRDSVDLIEAWQGANAAVIVDAVSSQGLTQPGTIYQIEVGNQSVPEKLFHYSTHNLSIAAAIDLSRALGTLPPHLTICGIEGENFEIGTGLSPEVEEAAEKVVQTIVRRAYATIEDR